jgi:hypothetical protein
MARTIIGKTTRTAITPTGVETIYEAYISTGPFAGATFEVLESELTDDEHEALDQHEQQRHEIEAENAWLRAAEYDPRMQDPREW